MPPRVAVVGNGGSGKTWVTRRLARALGVPAIHLDLFRYDADGTPRPDALFRAETMSALEASDGWVADGNYLGTLGERLGRAGVVVLLDLPALTCLAGVLTRRVRHRGRRVEDTSHADRFDLGFVSYVVSYNRRMRPAVLARLDASNCRLVRLRSRLAVRAFVSEVERTGDLG